MNNRTTAKAEELAANVMANMDPNAAQPVVQMQQQIMNQAMLHGINFTLYHGKYYENGLKSEHCNKTATSINH